MSICCVFAMALGLSFGVSTDTQAASSVKVIDGSQLTKDAESIGYNQKVARGEDLLTGYSKIVRMGPGQIYAGGTTIAEREVERIGVGVMIERAKEEDTEWSFYDSWNKFLENADRGRLAARLLPERCADERLAWPLPVRRMPSGAGHRKIGRAHV